MQACYDGGGPHRTHSCARLWSWKTRSSLQLTLCYQHPLLSWRSPIQSLRSTVPLRPTLGKRPTYGCAESALSTKMTEVCVLPGKSDFLLSCWVRVGQQGQNVGRVMPQAIGCDLRKGWAKLQQCLESSLHPNQCPHDAHTSSPPM